MNSPTAMKLATANIPAPDPGIEPLPPTPHPSVPPSELPPPIQDPALPGEHEPVREPSASAPISKRHQGPKEPVADAPPPATGPLAPGRPSHVEGIDLPLPHERDQALDQVATAPDPVMLQAKRDLDAGQVDTDMRATPGLDAERRNGLVPTAVPQTTSVPKPAPRVRTLKRR